MQYLKLSWFSLFFSSVIFWADVILLFRGFDEYLLSGQSVIWNPRDPSTINWCKISWSWQRIVVLVSVMFVLHCGLPESWRQMTLIFSSWVFAVQIARGYICDFASLINEIFACPYLFSWATWNDIHNLSLPAAYPLHLFEIH